MCFRQVTKQFWLVVYRLLKGKGLRFFSGPKNWGQVISKEASRGKYDPKKSEINFAVPDERYLRSMDRALGRIIQPGIITDSMRILEKHKDIVLMADCKRIAKGLKGDCLGDINLGGHEGSLTLQEKLTEYGQNCHEMQQYIRTLAADSDLQIYLNLRRVMKILTTQLKEVRLIEIQERRRLLNHERCNPDPNYKTAAKSSCRAHIYECKIFVGHALNLNNSICKILSFLQRGSCSFNSIKVHLEKQRNVRRLHDTDYIGEHINLEENPQYIKQGSQEWQAFRHKALVTASTAHSAMGFRGFFDVQKHFREFIYKKGPRHHNAETRVRLEYGSQHEIHGFSTIASVFMPALLPACAIMYEVGSYSKDGDVIQDLLIDSPDGLIAMEHNKDFSECCHPNIKCFCGTKKISVELKSPYPDPLKLPVQYEIPKYYILQILIHMALTGAASNWFGSVGPRSIVLIDARFYANLWNAIWTRIKHFLDKDRPVAKKWHRTILKDFTPQLDDYLTRCTELVAEVPLVSTEETRANFQRSPTFAPYHLPTLRNRQGPSRREVMELIHQALDKASTLLKDSFHILRSEASEIIAFVASDSSRVPQENVPPHIPIAYGLKGYSFPMTTMCKLINDVRDQCLDFQINVRCEVYDGQFLNLVCFTSTGQPLTHLAFLQRYYKELQGWSKAQCINFLLVDNQRQDENGHIVMRPRLDYTVSQHVLQIWKRDNERLFKRRKTHTTSKSKPGLDTEDINKLLRGSQLGRRLASRISTSQELTQQNDIEAEESDDDDADADDADDIADDNFVPLDTGEYLGTDDDDDDEDSGSESDLEAELEDLLNDTQDSMDAEQTFLEELLQTLRSLNPGRGKINWDEVTVDGLVNNYLRDPASCTKMLHDELNLIGNLVLTHTGIKIFNVSDTKTVKINKIIESMQTSSEKLHYTRRQKPKMKTLLSLSRAVVMKAVYSKTYVTIVVGRSLFETNAKNWLDRSTVPLDLRIDQEDGDYFEHESHCYPEFSERRNQNKFRCIDPGHTLANLRSQISRHGFELCSRDAFIRVSESNHNVLPKSIIDDKLDKQSIRIAKRFFSKPVEAELVKNQDDKEAKFVKLVREWYEACDKRGIDVYTRMQNLQNMYQFLTDIVEWEELQPPSTHIQGMPVQTYESLMQGISTRMLIFSMSTMPLNQRSVSTLAVESFFSDLTNMEFSGLGCPKAVDVPRLITHITQLNTICHNSDRGFVFKTTNRGVYPIDTLDPPLDRNSMRFDLPRNRRKRKAQPLLALPKAITRGQLTIREFHRKNESKVLLHKRAGVPDTFNAMDPS